MENLERFLKAQHKSYKNALSEIKSGEKINHWMWYIFPQIKGLGKSETSNYYAIVDKWEAKRYLNHPILGKRLIEISTELLKHEGKSAREIFGYPDDLKLHSSITLFSILPHSDPVFNKVLAAFFDNLPDKKTLEFSK